MRKYLYVFIIVSALCGLICVGNVVAQIEAIQGKGAGVEKENALISQVEAAAKARNWQEAENISKQLIVMNSDRWEYQKAFGDAEYNLGKYQEAMDAYEKAIGMVRKSANKDFNAAPAKIKAAVSEMFMREGNVYIKLKKNNEAIAAYMKSAELDPNPGVAYFNVCATLYNIGDMTGAFKACEKAIQIDPGRADTYFIKGSATFASGTIDKQGKYVVPAGTKEALNKYLELAPNGPHAADVKAMLEAVGMKPETTK